MIPRRLLLATGNTHKAEEMRAILTGLLPPGTELLSLGDIAVSPPPADVERFSTFSANARAKAIWCRDRSGLPCIADDSGICVDVLGGRPGIHSARWAGPSATDAQRNDLLLDALDAAQAFTPDQRRARFICAAALAFALPEQAPPSALGVSAIGVMHGFVLPRAQYSGGGGFGYDPLFFAYDIGMSAGEADSSIKNRYSHRGRALRSLASAFARE